MALPRRRPRDPEGRMSLAEHFREFRSRLVKAAFGVAIMAVVGWLIYGPVTAFGHTFKGVFAVLRAPVDAYVAANPDRHDDVMLIFNGVTTAFSLKLSVSIFTGLVLSSPIWLYQIWAFIVPGLTKKEKRVSRWFIFTAVPLFIAGILLAQFSLPLVVGVMLDFTPAETANFQQASDYISFVTRFSLGFGVAFLLPVFLIALNMVGILPYRNMLKFWRPAVFLIFVFSAMMMPTPDPYSMMLLAVPLIILYFAAVLIARIFDRRKEAQRPDWLDAEDNQASSI
ncbi:MAG: twin-arginine translocase subunit TatC [Nostocoides sp.]